MHAADFLLTPPTFCSRAKYRPIDHRRRESCFYLTVDTIFGLNADASSNGANEANGEILYDSFTKICLDQSMLHDQ